MRESVCKTCNGARLDSSVLSVLVGDKNIYEATKFSVSELHDYLLNLKLGEEQKGKFLNLF